MKKNKNPLFVVTNQGQDVEMAEGFFDAFIKKFNLEPVMNFLDILWEILLSQVSNFAMFQVVKSLVDEVVEFLEKTVKKVDPVLAFSIFQR